MVLVVTSRGFLTPVSRLLVSSFSSISVPAIREPRGLYVHKCSYTATAATAAPTNVPLYNASVLLRLLPRQDVCYLSRYAATVTCDTDHSD